jgi:hypothetical protein
MTEQPAPKRTPRPGTTPHTEHDKDHTAHLHDDPRQQPPAADSAPDEAAHDAPLYVCVDLTPEGQVRGVDLRDEAPEIEELLQFNVLRTVWLAPVPPVDSSEILPAREVLNLSVSTEYRQDDPEGWQVGQEAADRFHTEDAGERVMLRTVEAHLILAGVDNAHTGLVAAEQYGLTVTDPCHDLYVYRGPQGWQAYLEARYGDGGWDEVSSHLAPLDAAPADVAAAVQRVMADCDM